MRTNCSQVVVENFFEPGILYLLLKKPSYGYEIQKSLKINCICEVNTGNLYRCLARMLKKGYITEADPSYLVMVAGETTALWLLILLCQANSGLRVNITRQPHSPAGKPESVPLVSQTL